MDYCLGFHSPANKSAQKGSIVHKALEILAQCKVAIQDKQERFFNQELQREFSVSEVNPELAIQTAYWYYVKLNEFEYDDGDYTDCRKWMYVPLNWKGGAFNPLAIDVVAPEIYFDFEIERPWAEYSYVLEDGTSLKGNLSLKGTLDLTVKRDNDVIEIIDWKTGARFDWNKRKKKEYEDLCNDPQLRLYHYAAAHLFPKASSIFFTIFFMKDGGPFSICFQKSDLLKTEEVIKKRFNEMRYCNKPKLVYPDRKCGWCFFSKNSFDGPTDDYNKSICKQVKNDIIKLGIDKVTVMYARHGAFTEYVEGGGRHHDG